MFTSLIDIAMSLADSIRRKTRFVLLHGLWQRAANVCWLPALAAALLFGLGPSHLPAQQYLAEPDQFAGLDIKPVATFTSSRDVQPKGLSPAAQLALTIIAGKAEHSVDAERIVRPIAAIKDPKGRVLVLDTKPLSIRVLDFPKRKYQDINLAAWTPRIGRNHAVH